MAPVGTSGPSSDVLVVGSGVAGLTAAIFTARFGLSTRVLCPEGPGGALLSIEAVEDFPGFSEPVAGFELCPALQEQAQASGATFDMARVDRLEVGGAGGFIAHTDAGPMPARAVIAASGSAPRPLGVPGEDRLVGRGVSHCASCDGPLYSGRQVAVIGSGDAAFAEALELERCGVAAVTVIHRAERDDAMQTYRRRVLESGRISVLAGTSVVEVLGDEHVEAVRLTDGLGATSELEVAGVFVYVGSSAATEWLSGVVELSADGRVPTDAEMRASEPGIFAAGDVRAWPGRRFAVMAAGEGATAAVSAAGYLAPESEVALVDR